MKLFLIENAPVLRHFDFESMLDAQSTDCIIDDARLPSNSFYDIVFPARRFCEHQYRFIRCTQPIREREARTSQRCGSKKFSAAREFVHAVPFIDALPDARNPENLQTRGPVSIPTLSFPFPKSNTLR